MSILLDALRKSEQKQRLGDVPDIHQAAPGGMVESSSGPPWRGLAWLALPILLLLVWLTWRQLGPGPDAAGSAEPSAGVVTVAESDKAAIEPSQPTPEPAVELPTTRVASPVESLPSDSNATRQADSATSLNQAATEPTASAAAKPGPGVSVRALDEPQPGAYSSRSPGNASAATTTTAAPTNAATTSGSDHEESSSLTQAAAESEPWRPDRPGPMSYWQLPDDVRAAVGELKVSVLVYDDEPARRFILLNSERAEEGDSPRPGLTVEEIQRDGVVFAYQLYRFVLKR